MVRIESVVRDRKPLLTCVFHAAFGHHSLKNRRSPAAVNRLLETHIPTLFHAASTLSGSLRSPPSPRGEGFAGGIVFPHMHVFALTIWGQRCSRIVAFPIGEGGPRSGSRVLSLTAHLRRSSSLFFIPLPPSNLRPFGAPPSIGRRECLHEPLPLEGGSVYMSPFQGKGLPSATRRGWLPLVLS